jgi:hypothetical protein
VLAMLLMVFDHDAPTHKMIYGPDKSSIWAYPIISKELSSFLSYEQLPE